MVGGVKVLADSIAVTGAFLIRADLIDANLIGANLTNADLTRTILDDAIFCGTTMPDGTIRNDNC